MPRIQHHRPKRRDTGAIKASPKRDFTMASERKRQWTFAATVEGIAAWWRERGYR